MQIVFKIKEWMRDVRADYRIINNRKRKRKEARIDKKSVIFLFQCASLWNKSESVYQAFDESDEWEAIILHVPDLGIVSGTGEFSYEEYDFLETSKVIRAWSKEDGWYNLKKANPTFLFYTRPYDGYLPKEYKSYQTSLYTRICYISYFCATCELKETMPRSFFRNLEYFFADGEISLQMAKKMFPISQRIGIHHFLKVGFPTLDKLIESEDKKSNLFLMKDRFRVMWTPRWSNDAKLGKSTFFKYIEDVIAFFSESNQYELVFRPHPLLFDNFIQTGLISKERVDEIRQVFEKYDNLHLDESPNYFETFWASDVLITDLSSLNQEYLITGKPIIFTHEDMGMLNRIFAEIATSYYSVSSWKELEACLQMLQMGKDDKRELRQKMIEKYFGELGGAVKNIVESIEKL